MERNTLLHFTGLVAAAMASSDRVPAADLTIHLAGAVSISRESVEYRCDQAGTKIGVPAGSFTVEYINGGGNSLAVVPISGDSIVFSNVFAGSGARYTAKRYTWWEAGPSVTLSSDSLAGKMHSNCHRVETK